MVGFWIALAVLAAGVVVGLVFAIVRGLRLWRQVKRTGGSFGREADRISQVAASISDQLDRAGASAEQLRAAAERLERSRAALAVQQAAIREARLAVRRTFWFIPGV